MKTHLQDEEIPMKAKTNIMDWSFLDEIYEKQEKHENMNFPYTSWSIEESKKYVFMFLSNLDQKQPIHIKFIV